jgi:hypothetical protein
MKFYNGLQDILLSCGKNGCLFLDYLKAASINGYDFDLTDILLTCLKSGIIDNDFTVNDGCKLLTVATGKSWAVSQYSDINKDYLPISSYKSKQGDIIIKGYGNTKVGHWDMDEFHPMKHSVNKETGKVLEYRVCREVK